MTRTGQYRSSVSKELREARRLALEVSPRALRALHEEREASTKMSEAMAELRRRDARAEYVRKALGIESRNKITRSGIVAGKAAQAEYRLMQKRAAVSVDPVVRRKKP